MIADGRHIANLIEERLKSKIASFPEKKVCFIVFGNNPASMQFVAMKSKVAMRLGVAVEIVEVPENVSTSHALEIVETEAKKNYNGIVVQLPLPSGLETQKILDAVPAHLDIDGLRSDSEYVAPVALAVKEILNFYSIDLMGKKILLLGNGKLVGAPVGALLARSAIPFGIADKNTDEVMRNDLLKNADVIISGAGVPHLITSSMIKDDVVLIDAGTSEQSGKLVGDIDPACGDKASLMTPVPGGVGPVTVACLFANLIRE